MQEFLNFFFFYDSIPFLFQLGGENFGFDTACLCSYPNFFNLIIHFVVAALIVAAIAKPTVKDKRFFSWLLFGVIFSGLSKLIDWSQNILTATGETVFWSNSMDVFVEALQFVGIAIILWALFDKLRKRVWE